MRISPERKLPTFLHLVHLSTAAAGITIASAYAFPAAAAQAPVDLGTAGNFVVLTKTGVTNVPTSAITGDIGTSPIASTAITGFSMVADATGRFATSSQVTGRIYAANYASPVPAQLTTAIGDMQTAYGDAAGRSLPDFTELHAGDLSGKTLVPGLYKWSTGVSISSDVTLAGGPEAIWILQIAGNLTVSSATKVLLSGGARAQNIYWQVAGGVGVEVGTTAHLEGTVLAAKAIHLRTGASLNGRALSQTAVTLAKNRIVASKPRLCGDFNDDGRLTAADALGVLRAAVGDQTCPLSACDFDGDGEVTATDASMILRAAVGDTSDPLCPGL